MQKSTFSKKKSFVCSFYAPAMTMAGALSVTPVCLSVRTYLRTYIRTYVRLSKRRPLSNLYTFYQNFMKLVHIV